MKLSCALAVLLALGCATPAPPPPTVPGWHELGADAEVAIEADEQALWKRAGELRAEIEKEERLLEDDALASYVDGVLRALLPDTLPLAAPEAKATVVRSTDLQAGTSANGAIYLSLGLLASLENEAQLAALLGHELGHFLGRHSLVEKRYEALSRSTVERMNLARANEYAADRIGLELMRAAGYAPDQTPRLIELMRSEDLANRTPHPAWESHPFVDARIGRIRERIRPSDNGKTEAARYEAAIADALAVAAELELEAGMRARARVTLARHQRLRPGSGHGFYLKGELERREAPEGRRAPGVRAAYERAVELAPEDPDALRALGLLLREQGELERAQMLLARYVKSAPSSPERTLIERTLARPAPEPGVAR